MSLLVCKIIQNKIFLQIFLNMRQCVQTCIKLNIISTVFDRSGNSHDFRVPIPGNKNKSINYIEFFFFFLNILTVSMNRKQEDQFLGHLFCIYVILAKLGQPARGQ